MKAVVGIDLAGAWQVPLDLLTRLWPMGLEATLIHSLESVMPDGGFPELSSGHPLTEIYVENEAAGKKALQDAASYLSAKGATANTQLCRGEPARHLIEAADQTDADVIVVRSSVKHALEAVVFGSTAKGVLIGAKQSVLVVRGDHSGSGKVDCLLATDHSDYAGRCVGKLKSLSPSGIKNLTVFTANEIDSGVSALLVRGLPDLADDAPLWIAEKLAGLNDKIGADLGAFCESHSSLVKAAGPITGIRDAMTETQSELLIIGAQGHGFWERLTLGSKSMHHVLYEPYSVLVVRV